MSRRSKLQKFAENLVLPNVFENFSFENPKLCAGQNREVDYASRWVCDFFNNQGPLVVELACGAGEYCLGLSDLYPDKNFIGIDIKGARIWKGAKTAIGLNKTRIAFLRCRIELMPHFFGTQEIDEIWICFPDPFPRKSKANRRLTARPFLDIYQALMKKNALLHLKTDDPALYQFSLDTIGSHPAFAIGYHHDDIYSAEAKCIEWDIKTTYERKHLADGKTIKYIRAYRI